jgi:hypothetical protein
MRNGIEREACTLPQTSFAYDSDVRDVVNPVALTLDGLEIPHTGGTWFDVPFPCR